MNKNIKIILSISLSSIWISISEFLRNEYLLKSFWINHYRSLNLNFPNEPINGAFWGIWSILFSILIYSIAQKFNYLNSLILSWIAGFLMMWVVIGNLGVLPFDILVFAIPLSLIEVALSIYIIKVVYKKSTN